MSEEGRSQTESQVDPVKLPRRLMKTFHPEGRINQQSVPKHLIELVEALHNYPEFGTITSSCFGKLFKLQVRKCSVSGRLVHSIISRQLVTLKKHESWFLYGGRPIRFSLREFAILTGLNCRPYTEEEKKTKADATPVPESDKYWDTLIGKDKNPSIKTIVDWLKEDTEMDPDRRVKLALIVIVEGVLNCGNKANCPSFEIVEKLRDIDDFLQYPWGRHCFEKTREMWTVGPKVESTDALIEKLEQRSHILVHGFPLVIQLLAFKAVPHLLTKVPTHEDETTFTDRSILHMTLLKTFHTKFIEQTEDLEDLSVDCIITTDEEPEKEEVMWDDEVEDPAVDYMVEKITYENGLCFKKQHWRGGHKGQFVVKSEGSDVNKNDGTGRGKRKKTGRGDGRNNAKRSRGAVEKVRGGGREGVSEDDLVEESDSDGGGIRFNGRALVQSVLEGVKVMLKEERRDERKDLGKVVSAEVKKQLAAFMKHNRGKSVVECSSTEAEDTNLVESVEATSSKVSNKRGRRGGVRTPVKSKPAAPKNKKSPKKVPAARVVVVPSRVTRSTAALLSHKAGSGSNSKRKAPSKPAAESKSRKKSREDKELLDVTPDSDEDAEKLRREQDKVALSDKSDDGANHDDVDGDGVDGMAKEQETNTGEVGEADSEKEAELEGAGIMAAILKVCREQSPEEDTSYPDDHEPTEDAQNSCGDQGNDEEKNGGDDFQGTAVPQAEKNRNEEAEKMRNEDDEEKRCEDDEEKRCEDDEENHNEEAEKMRNEEVVKRRDDVNKQSTEEATASGEEVKDGESTTVTQIPEDVIVPEGTGQSAIVPCLENKDGDGRKAAEKPFGKPNEVAEKPIEEAEKRIENVEQPHEEVKKPKEVASLAPALKNTSKVVKGNADPGRRVKFASLRNPFHDYMRARKKGNPTQDGKVAGPTFSPFDVPLVLELEFFRLLKTHKDELIDLDGMNVKKEFFLAIMDPRIDLLQTHMDAIINSLWRRNADRWVAQKMAFVDSWFFPRMSSCWQDFVVSLKAKKAYEWPSNVTDYVKGEIPARKEKLRWMVDVTVIYAPMCWYGVQWVGVKIDLLSRTISVFDSNIGVTKAPFMKKVMDPIRQMLAHLLNFTKVSDEPSTKWFFSSREKKVSINADPKNSGPLACKYMEMNAMGRHDFKSIDLLGTEDIRMGYAMDVYETFVRKFRNTN